MKAIIIYKGKYGATKQYAEWLGYELNLAVATTDEINGSKLAPYDVLILGTSIYVGKFQIKKWLEQNWRIIRNRKIFIFQVAGTPLKEIAKRESYNQQNIPAEIKDQCTVFNLPGRMVIEKLSWFDRFMLKMGARMVKNPDEKKAMLTNYDGVEKECLREIVKGVRNVLNPSRKIEAEQLIDA